MIKTYYTLTKPGIIYGNLLIATGGFLLASNGRIRASLLLAILVGTACIIASACVCNNYLDRIIDAKMSRTKKRALVQGLISTRSALLFATSLGLLGIVILAAFTNPVTLGIGLAAFLGYVVLYGLAKRRSVHGTLVGSLPGAASIVAGYSTVTGRLDLGALLLFLIMVTWQMPHFYAIALYRLKDYQTANLPVLPAIRGVAATKRQIVLYIVAFMATCSLLTSYGYAGYTFLAIMLLLGLRWLQLGTQGFRPDAQDTPWARQMFFFSLIMLLTLAAMLSLNAWIP